MSDRMREIDQTWKVAALLLLKAAGGGSIQVPLTDHEQVEVVKDIGAGSMSIVDNLETGMRTITMREEP